MLIQSAALTRVNGLRGIKYIADTPLANKAKDAILRVFFNIGNFLILSIIHTSYAPNAIRKPPHIRLI